VKFWKNGDTVHLLNTPQKIEERKREMGRAHDSEDAGFCLPAPSNLLAEFCWRQPDKMCTCTYSLATFLAAPSNFLSLPSTTICYKNNSIHGKQLS
jgi:hypothetical protein